MSVNGPNNSLGCVYNCAARLTGPAWGPAVCGGTVCCQLSTVAMMCLSICCYGKAYVDGSKDDECTPRGPSKEGWDSMAVCLLRSSSFAPNIDKAVYQARVVERTGQSDTWANHVQSCGKTACLVSLCAMTCGPLSALCACCPDADPCRSSLETLLIGEKLDLDTKPLVTTQPN